MKFTVNIKEQSKIVEFLHLVKENDYIEIVDAKESPEDLHPEHKELLSKRLQRIINGETTFKDWDLIKTKYENKVV